MHKENKHQKELDTLKQIPQLYEFTKKYLKIKTNKKIDLQIPSIFLTKYMDIDITDEIQAFGNILNQEGCITFQGKKDIIFYNVKNLEEIDNIYNHFKLLVSNYKKFSNEYKGILYLEISDLENIIENEKLNDFFRFIDDYKDNIYFIFAYTKKDSKDESKKISQKILDKFYIYEMEIEPPNKTELSYFLKQYLEKKYDFKLYKNNLSYIEQVIDTYFMKNLNKTIYKYPLFIEELVYYILLNNEGKTINKATLKNAIKNNTTLKSISKVDELVEKQTKIGFCIDGIGRE
ncbi:MAG: hypothetical protein ACI4PU_00825 [Intestinibacter sp.]